MGCSLVDIIILLNPEIEMTNKYWFSLQTNWKFYFGVKLVVKHLLFNAMLSK